MATLLLVCGVSWRSLSGWPLWKMACTTVCCRTETHTCARGWAVSIWSYMRVVRWCAVSAEWRSDSTTDTATCTTKCMHHRTTRHDRGSSARTTQQPHDRRSCLLERCAHRAMGRGSTQSGLEATLQWTLVRKELGAWTATTWRQPRRTSLGLRTATRRKFRRL